MNKTDFSRLKNIVIISLVILNLVCLWFLFSKAQPPGIGVKDGQRMKSRDRLQKEIGLDKEQQERFESLVKLHKKELRAKMREMKSFRQEMIENLENDSFDIEAATHQTAMLQKELDLLAYAHFRELRSICREDQKGAFDSSVKKIWLREPRRKFKKH